MHRKHPILVAMWRGCIPATYRYNIPVSLLGERLTFSDGTPCPHNIVPEVGLTHGIRVFYTGLEESRPVKRNCFYGWFDLIKETRLAERDPGEHPDNALIRLCAELASVITRESFPSVMIFRTHDPKQDREIERAWEDIVAMAIRRVFRSHSHSS